MKAAFYLENEQMAVREAARPETEQIVFWSECGPVRSAARISEFFIPVIIGVTPPQILGHEIAGDVVEAGANVTRVKVQDRVAIGADVPCGMNAHFASPESETTARLIMLWVISLQAVLPNMFC